MLVDQISDAILAAAASPWVYPFVFGLTVLDAFLVVIPSETIVVALGALSAESGQPLVVPLLAVAGVAAVLGDTLTFALGRAVGLRRFEWMRRPRVIRSFEWAQRALDRRAALVLLTARFVPFARIAVNLTAGATGFSYPRFLTLTAIAGVCWALYNVGIGAFFGTVYAGNPVIAVAVSVAVAVTVGFVIDRIGAAVAHRRAS